MTAELQSLAASLRTHKTIHVFDLRRLSSVILPNCSHFANSGLLHTNGNDFFLAALNSS